MIIPTWPWPLTFAFGSIKSRPVVKDGVVVARNTMRLTLAVDRRLANGAPLARFAERVRVLLEGDDRDDCQTDVVDGYLYAPLGVS